MRLRPRLAWRTVAFQTPAPGAWWTQRDPVPIWAAIVPKRSREAWFLDFWSKSGVRGLDKLHRLWLDTVVVCHPPTDVGRGRIKERMLDSDELAGGSERRFLFHSTGMSRCGGSVPCYHTPRLAMQIPRVRWPRGVSVAGRESFGLSRANESQREKEQWRR
jgi:hypothetical protein